LFNVVHLKHCVLAKFKARAVKLICVSNVEIEIEKQSIKKNNVSTKDVDYHANTQNIFALYVDYCKLK